MTDQTQNSQQPFIHDKDLLRRFLLDSDEEAFAMIVRRHQGLVKGVCRRVIGCEADIDDAFQATFLALARRPRSIRKAVCLSSWLYTVAWRACLRLVKQRQKSPEVGLNIDPQNKEADTLQQIANQQDSKILDEELNALSAKYRDVLVMTYFAEQSSQEIADQLCESKGTIDGRLRQARNVLRVRLARRGVGIGALVVAVSFQPSTALSANVDPLVESAIQLGNQAINGTSSLPNATIQLELLARPDTIMTTSKLILTTTLCLAAIVTAAKWNSTATGQDQQSNSISAIDAIAEPFDSELDVEAQLENLQAETSVQNQSISPSTESNQKITPDVVFANQPFKPFPANASAQRQWFEAILEQPIPRLDFPGETSLKEILDTLQAYYSTTYGNEDLLLTIYPDIKELDLEGINSLEDVLISDIELRNIKFKDALALIFEQTQDPQLDYLFQNGVMKVTSMAKIDDKLVTRVFDVSELLHQLGLESSTGSNSENGVDHPLCDLIARSTIPLHWREIDEQGGEIRVIAGKLIVRQTPKGQQKITKLLNALSQ